MQRNGILCLEGDWDEGLKRRRSLVPVLDLLQGQWEIPYIHRTASTRDEFRRVIQEWLKAKYSAYPILYLGFHGYPGAIQLGEEEVALTDLYEFNGRGRGRLIHFGSCETLRASKRILNRFLSATRLVAICGFRSEVDWLHCCALEVIILDQLTSRKISARNIHVFRQSLSTTAGTLVRSLGFQVWERGKLRS